VGVRALPVASGASGHDVGYEVVVDAPRGVDLVVLRLELLSGRPQHLVVSPSATVLRGRVSPRHSGPQELVRAALWVASPDAGLVGGPVGPVAVGHVAAPRFSPAQQLPLPRSLRGLSGVHDASRPGDGGEFRDIGSFTPGDRLRRIDWKATARRARFDGDLYVRRTTATADATAVVVLDTRDDLGEVVREWTTNRPGARGTSSLDLARQAASSIAAGTVRTGDRIGFCDLGVERRSVPLGAGRRHLQRVLSAIAVTRAVGVMTVRRRPPVVPAAALVYLLSTFLDDGAPSAARRWQAAGHRVVAVDVLPAPRLAGATPEQRMAHRILVMEREDRLEDLRVLGVEVVHWQEAPDAAGADAQLRALARRRRRP
jgi:uncharacterized protein (DUF58 family)